MLSLIIFLPLLFAIAICFIPAKQAKYGALLATGLLLLLTLIAGFASGFDWSGSYTATATIGSDGFATSFQLRQFIEWIPDLGISYVVGADTFSMVMLIMSAALAFIAVLASWTAINGREKEFYFHLLVLLTGLFGSFLALDLFLFYIFFEVMLIPLYFLVGIWGGAQRTAATMKLMIYTLVGSVLMLVGILWMYANSGLNTYSYELLIAQQNSAGIAAFAQSYWPFLALAFGFCVKLALFPFHTWQPDAYSQAPTAVTVLLAGAILKTGGYGLVRFCLPLFPDAAVAFAPLFLWLGAISIVYGAALAIVQTDLKRLIAYSSISHMGFVIVGLFSFNAQGVQGALIQLVSHAISVTGLFLVIGYLEERRGTRLLSEYGGLARNLPICAALAMVMLLSSVGLPGLNGFIGEFNVLLGSMKAEPILLAAQSGGFYADFGMTQYSWLLATLAGLGVILAAIYLLRMYQGVFFGKLNEAKNGNLTDLLPREWAPLAVLAVLALVIGLYPRPLMQAFEPTTRITLAAADQALGKTVAPAEEAVAALVAE